jgi:hypothetical protein
MVCSFAKEWFGHFLEDGLVICKRMVWSFVRGWFVNLLEDGLVLC